MFTEPLDNSNPNAEMKNRSIFYPQEEQNLQLNKDRQIKQQKRKLNELFLIYSFYNPLCPKDTLTVIILNVSS